MDTNFQTSFIPKKPAVVEKPSASSRPVGLLTTISIFIFFTVLIGAIVLYFYKVTLTKGITRMQNDLSLAQNRFEPEKITQLELLNRRIEAGKMVLQDHVAVSPIFDALGKVTKKSVRYTKFNLSNEESGKVLIKLSGIATDYRSVALQSDLFNQNKHFIDPVFSNLAVNEKGNVNFDLEFSLDRTFVDYQKVLDGTNNPSDYFDGLTN